MKGITMKLLSVILSFAILLSGCYTHTTVTKDDILDSSSGLTFVLKDGSSIEANRWCYFRLENGYQIASTDGTPSVIVLDEQIDTIEGKENDPVMTVVVGTLVIGGFVSLLWLVGASQVGVGAGSGLPSEASIF